MPRTKGPRKRSTGTVIYTGSKRPCDNCGEPGPHFVPPSLGEPGFFMCKKKVNDAK